MHDDLLTPSYRFATKHFAEEDQFDAYYSEFSIFGRVVLPDDKKIGNGFHAERTGYRVGVLDIVTAASEAYSFERTNREKLLSGLDHWVIILRGNGWADIDIGGGTTRFEGNKIELRAVAAAKRGRLSASQSMLVYLPRSEFSGIEGLLDRLSEVDSSVHIHPLLGHYLRSLEKMIPSIRTEECPLVAETTVAMVRACMSPTDGSLAAARSPIMTTQLEVAKNYIERNLSSPVLTVKSLCRELGISERQLYKVFERHGGVSSFIRSRRLSACHAAILSRGQADGIAHIAADFGFLDMASFGKQFRAEFGYSPYEAIEAAGQIPLKSSYIEWLRSSRQQQN